MQSRAPGRRPALGRGRTRSRPERRDCDAVARWPVSCEPPHTATAAAFSAPRRSDGGRPRTHPRQRRRRDRLARAAGHTTRRPGDAPYRCPRNAPSRRLCHNTGLRYMHASPCVAFRRFREIGTHARAYSSPSTLRRLACASVLLLDLCRRAGSTHRARPAKAFCRLTVFLLVAPQLLGEQNL